MANSGFRKALKFGALALTLFVVFGCLGGGGSLTSIPSDEKAVVKMKIRLGRTGTQNGTSPVVVLNKASSIQIKKLLVRFVSALGDTVQDTVTAGNSELGAEVFFADSILIDVNLPALRWWNIEIETRDQNDSVIHRGKFKKFASMGGQVIDIDIPQLDSRYMMYEARYTLPEEIYASGVSDTARVVQKIYFCKLRLEIDQGILRDSSSFNPDILGPGTRFMYADPSKLKGAAGALFFKPNRTGDTATHVQSYEYLLAGEHEFRMSAYGYLEGDSVGRLEPRILYQGKATIKINASGTTSQQEVKLDYKGPGSGAVTDSSASNPGGPNWNGIRMTVTLGRVKGGKATVNVIGGVEGL